MKRIENPWMLSVVVCLLSSVMAWAAPVVLNPSFEEPPFPGNPGGWDEGAGNPVGWTWNGGSHIGGVYGAGLAPQLTGAVKVLPVSDGVAAAYLWTAWSADCTMSQTVNGFDVGKKYALMYLEGSQSGTATDHFYVTLGGDTLVDHVIAADASAWNPIASPTFVASNTSLNLTFHVQALGDGDRSSVVFDAVSFTEIPEPTTAALALGGLVFALRRRRA